MKKKYNYTVSLILPNTKEGMEELEDKYTSVVAKITADKLRTEELEMLIEYLKNEKQ